MFWSIFILKRYVEPQVFKIFLLPDFFFFFSPGEVDAQILTLLQSVFPAVPITADIVEGSSELSDNFKGINHSHSHHMLKYFYSIFRWISSSGSSLPFWKADVLVPVVKVLTLSADI